MTTWGDTTTLQSTILDEATVDDTTGGIEDETTTEQATTTEEVTTTEEPTIETITESAETVKSSAIDPERDTRARPILDVDLGLEEASGDNDSDY